MKQRLPIPTIAHPLHQECRILLAHVDIRGFRIPRGFVWNGTSIPGPLRPWLGDPFEGPNRDAGLLHDYLYRTKKAPRDQADELFRRELIADGDSPATARLKWAAVRVAASSHYGSEEWPSFVPETTLALWEQHGPLHPLTFASLA